MSSPEAVAFVFYGEDEPRLREALAAFLEKYSDDPTTDMNLTRLDGKATTSGDIEGAAATLPFLAETRLLIVENFTEAPQAKAIIKDELPTLLDRLPDWARVAFTETGAHALSDDSRGESKRKSARRRLIKSLVNIVEQNARGKVFTFTLPDKQRDRVGWIIERAKYHQAEIEGGAANVLSQRVGHNLPLLDNELIKLATYTNGQRAITVQDVDLLTPYEPEINIFDLVDAIGLREGRQALDKLRSLLEEENQSPLQVYAMIIRQYRLLLQVREQLDKGRHADSIRSVLNLHPYVAKKLTGQAQRYSIRLLERIYEVLLEIDLEIKTGKQKDHQLALETLIVRLTQ